MIYKYILVVLFLLTCNSEPTIIGKWNLVREKPKETLIIKKDSTLIVQVQVESGEQFSLNGTWIKLENNFNIKFDVDGIKKTVITEIKLRKDSLTVINTTTNEKSTYVRG